MRLLWVMFYCLDVIPFQLDPLIPPQECGYLAESWCLVTSNSRVLTALAVMCGDSLSGLLLGSDGC